MTTDEDFIDKYIKNYEKKVNSNIKENTKNMKYTIYYKVDNFIYSYAKEFIIVDDDKIIKEQITYYNINKKSIVHNIFNRRYHTKQVHTAFNYTLCNKEKMIKISDLSNIGLRKLTSLITPCNEIIRQNMGQTKILDLKHLKNIDVFFTN